MKIGYARVSTGLQNLDLQKDSLETFGCEKIFTDHISGAKNKRPGLETAIEFVRSGDTLAVWRLDRLGRNMEDLITIVNRLNERGVSFIAYKKILRWINRVLLVNYCFICLQPLQNLNVT